MGYHGYRSWLEVTGLISFDEYAHSVLKAYALLKRYGVRFYTLPPIAREAVVPWPWILVNVFNVDVLATYIDRYREVGARIESVILDAAVDKVWKKSIDKLPINRDYGDDYWNAFWNAIDYLKSLSREHGFAYEIVIPDYCDDYSRTWGRRHALWTEECCDYVTNIDRTLSNILQVVDSDRSIPWLIPAQGYEDVPESIFYSVEILKQLGLHKRFRIAIANVCTSRAATIIAETVRKAREACRECSFHIFGPSLSGAKKLIQEKLLLPNDSWDSTAWTFPRTSHGWSCKNEHERILYFLLYMNHLEKALR
ncbi:MAG: hypothetical protein GXO32_02125 [Crenarchaeota archaeon]|nr:hypothetical protein [Thermoproteota archaeon]